MGKPESRVARPLVIAALLAVTSSLAVHAQMRQRDRDTAQPATSGPIRITMDELHAHGGVPPG